MTEAYAVADAEGALAAFETILAGAPHHPDALAGRGNALLTLGATESERGTIPRGPHAGGVAGEGGGDLGGAVGGAEDAPVDRRRDAGGGGGGTPSGGNGGGGGINELL